MNRFINTERVGLNEVEKIFLSHKWIARLILQTDVGIDMEVEICENDEPTAPFNFIFYRIYSLENHSYWF